MPHEFVKFTGTLRIELFDETGSLKDVRDIKNTVVTVGKGFIVSRMVGESSAVMSHMAVGTGSTTPSVTDTTLQNEQARVVITAGTALNSVATYTATFPSSTGAAALTEAAIFNVGVAGTMLARTTFNVVNKGANDSISITWLITAA